MVLIIYDNKAYITRLLTLVIRIYSVTVKKFTLAIERYNINAILTRLTISGDNS